MCKTIAKLILCAGWFIGLSACIQTGTPPMNISSSVPSPNLAETLSLSPTVTISFADTPGATIVPTPKPTFDPTSTDAFVQPEVDFTQLSGVGVGQIWAYREKEKAFLVIDLDKQRAFFSEGLPEGCGILTISGTTELNCLSATPPYIYNLLSMEKTYYPQGTEEILHPATADTGAVILKRTLGPTWEISVLDSTVKTVFSSVKDVFRFGGILSPDFQYILAKSDNQIGLIDWQTGEFQPVSASDVVVTDNFDWAPDGQSFLYGTMSFELEIGLQADTVYYYDMESQAASILATPPVPYRAYNEGAWPVWSPDSERVVLIAGNNLCVVHVGSKDQQCTEIVGARFDNVMSIWPIHWSPDSRKIAFITHIDDSSMNTLMIFDVASRSLTHIADGAFGDSLFWIQPKAE